MAETTDTAVLVDELRDEMRGQLDDMRRQLRQLRQMIAAPGRPAPRRPSPEELEAHMDAFRKLHERILRRRGGELLPPVAEDIARAREERTAQILGETVQ